MLDAIRRRAAGLLWKAAVDGSQISMLPGWVRDPIRDFTMKTIIEHGYKNPAVFACVRVLAESFPEPELHVWEQTPEGETVMHADHPLRQLLRRPNPYMAEDEFWEFCITYAAVGGNFYLWKERDQLGQVIALYPFHDGQLKPVLDGRRWIDGYTMDVENGGTRESIMIPASEIIHWRWAIDPRQPQVGLSPIVAASRTIDMDTEFLRYTHALAHNDAVPRTIIKTRVGFNDAALQQLKAQWVQRFGGANRGDVAILNDADAEVIRLGSNLTELAVEAIHNIPESRIAAVYGGAPVGYLAGLNVHLQRSTFSNYEAAELALHRRILMAKWRSVEGVMTHGLLSEFDTTPGLSLRFDVARVAALAGERQAREQHALTMFQAGLWSRNESRAATGARPLAEDVIMAPANVLPEPVMYEAEPGALVLLPPMVADAAAMVDTGESADPASTLNGAQIESLLLMIQSIGTGAGQLPKETVVKLIVTAFALPEERARQLVEEVPATGLPQPTDPAAQKARPLPRRREDTAAARAALVARRELVAEHERTIAAALKAEQEAVLEALGAGD